MENDHQLEIVEPNSSYQYYWKCIENSAENVFVRNISSSQWLWYIYYDLNSEILLLIRNNIRKLFFFRTS